MPTATSYRNTLDPSSGWSGKLRGSEHFPSPFLDMASLAMPESNRNALEWCEYVFQSNGTYRMAMERIISYFLTDLELGALNANRPLGDDEKEKWENFLVEQLGALGHVQDMDRDRMCYGNAFASVVVPFKRFLSCRCGNQFPLDVVYRDPKFRFKFTDYEFHATCPGCNYSGKMKTWDAPLNTAEQLSVKRWSPHEIQILHDPLTEQVEYYWKIPEDYKRLVRQGRLFHLMRVPKDVLQAIKKNQLFRFNPGVLYHMKEPTLGGMENRGWGISRVIVNFRQVWYVQVLHRYNEAIALDYVIPFRLITPAARSGSSQASGQGRDPLLTVNMGDFMGQVKGMIRRRSRDPAGWNTLPFPVDYQALGGDAAALAPRELLDQGMETLLNASGTPVELYKGTLQLQTAPVSLRLFESTWHHLVHDNNAFMHWLTERVSRILSWEDVLCRHKRVTHADDMQRHMAILQLMMGGTISQSTGLKAMGVDWKDEMRLIGEEGRYMQEQSAKVQEEMDTQAFGAQISSGQPMQGGAPGQPMPPGGGGGGGGGAAGGGGGIPVDPATGQPMPQPVTTMVQNDQMPQTPEEMMSTAESIAQQLLGLPEGQKDSELRSLKQKNEVLHALVRQKLDQIRGRARSQGGSMLLDQEFGGGGGGGAPPAGGPPA
jgi:hypothetical protein